MTTINVDFKKEDIDTINKCLYAIRNPRVLYTDDVDCMKTSAIKSMQNDAAQIFDILENYGVSEW